MDFYFKSICVEFSLAQYDIVTFLYAFPAFISDIPISICRLTMAFVSLARHLNISPVAFSVCWRHYGDSATSLCSNGAANSHVLCPA